MDLKVKTEFKTKKALLVIDNFAGHKFEEQKLAEFEQQGLIIKYLRPYTTSICQPLDLNINFLLKSSLKDQWIDWIDQHPNINPTKQTIYNWLVQAWKKITPLNIIKAFLMSGISNDLDGSSDILCPNLQKLKKKNNENDTITDELTPFDIDPYLNEENPIISYNDEDDNTNEDEDDCRVIFEDIKNEENKYAFCFLFLSF